MKKTIEVGEAFVRAVPIPQDTETYVAIPHASVIDTIDRVLMEEAKLKRIGVKFRSASGGDIIAGMLNYKGAVDSLGLSVAFVNSYNKMRVLKIGCGSVVWVCENGMLSAEFSVERKHTGYIRNELPMMLSALAEVAVNEHKKNVVQKDEMSGIILNDRQRAEYYGRLIFEEEIISPIQCSNLKAELENKQGKFRGNTLWDAYNNVTQVLKSTHPMGYLEAHMTLHQITRESFALTI